MEGYLYFTKHGVGPGTLPNDVKLVKWEDKDDNITAIWTDRPLSTKELDYFDIYSESSDKHEELKKRYNVFESLTDNDIELISNFELNEEEVSTLLSLFELISEDNKNKAIDLITNLFANKTLTPVEVKLDDSFIETRESESLITRRLLGDI